MELAAAQNRAALGFFLQGKKGIERIADPGKGQGAIDGVDDPRRGGPAVKKGHLVGLKQLSRMAGCAAFFIHKACFLIAQQIVRCAARLQNDIAAQQHDRAAVAVEIATNGHL